MSWLNTKWKMGVAAAALVVAGGGVGATAALASTSSPVVLQPGTNTVVCPTPTPSTPAPTPKPSPSAPPPSNAPTPVPTPTAGAFPTAATTGVPAGTVLKASGSIGSTTVGQVISGLDVHGTINITTNNVVVKNSRVTGSAYAIIRVASNLTGVVVQDSLINGGGTSAGTANSGGIIGPARVVRDDISGVENGLVPGNGEVVTGTFIHNLGAPGPAHYDGIQIDGGLHSITIQDSTVIDQFGQTSAIMTDNYYGALDGVTINHNLLSGGDYTVYADAHFNSSKITNEVITNNSMSPGFYGYHDFNGTSPVFAGNTDTKTGAVLK